MSKIMAVYMQDKRAKKSIPARGTKKYPVILIHYLCSVDGDGITIPPGSFFVSGLAMSPKQYRFYVHDEDESRWIDSPKLFI